MAQKERTMSPPFSTQVSNLAKAAAPPSLSPLRHRPMNRASNFADSGPTLRPRRSSTFSESASSFKSSTDDLLLPRASNVEEAAGHEPSHWHSVPLALALLPAIGGLLFEKGSAVVTDVTLLALAAIFLNWSVRLPWDWYHSAQAVERQEPWPAQSYKDRDAIIEEGSDEDASQPSQPNSPAADSKLNNAARPSSTPQPPAPAQVTAAGELRIHELLALATCFISPIIGAWLLHHIRAQLSRPSEGLVSNYNLTIFLLASELRPLSHLIKLVQARTLHLQRTVSSNPHLPPSANGNSDVLFELTARLTRLEETQLPISPSANGPKSPTLAQQQQQADLVTATRKILQPDVDALNRAVRRYEKRATLLTMQTESRLQELEGKLADAITLAAAAERSSQASKQRRGSGVVAVVDWISWAVMLPVQVTWAVVTWPGKVVGGVMTWAEDFVGGKVRREMKTATGRVGGGSGSSGERRRGGGRAGKKVA